jgi:hypothetical protein
MKSTKKIIGPILSERTSLLELFLIAFVLAMGVSLIADAMPRLLAMLPLVQIAIGSLFCLATAGYLVLRFMGNGEQAREYQGFFVYDKTNYAVLPVPQYDFASDIAGYLKSAFVENGALKVLWEKEPLSEIWKGIKFTGDGKAIFPKQPRSMQIVAEVSEYYVLEKLSTHLTDYFNRGDYAAKNLREYTRGDIPAVLLSNRFLELFSKPMQDRPHFVDQAMEKDTAGQIAWSGTREGARYSRFDLRLPRRSSVRRPQKNEIEIDTPRMTMLIQIIFQGFGAPLPRGFESLYLGIQDVKHARELIELQVDVGITVHFKPGALLSTSGWEYYHWVDSFLGNLQADLSQTEFLSRINWETAYATYLLQRGQQPTKRNTGARRPGGTTIAKHATRRRKS